MILKILETLSKNNCNLKGKNLTVALSGGADSVALLLAMKELEKMLDIGLFAVHINHCLRGNESNRDQEFCENLCRKLNVELTVFNVDINKKSKELKLGIEHTAREVRYQIFAQIARNGYVATAHNKNDQAETLLLNLTRGSSLKGLKSIPFKRDFVIRPLLEISRQEIENYLSEKNQNFVTDSSNLTTDYNRNKIRHNIIPVLEEINPSFLNATQRLVESVALTDDYISSQVNLLLNQDLKVRDLLKNHEAIIFDYLDKLVKQNLNIALEYTHLKSALKALKTNSKCQLPLGYYILVQHDKINFSNKNQKQEDFSIIVNQKIIKTPFNSYNFQEFSNKDFFSQKNVNNLLFKNAINCDKLKTNLILRSRKNGDKIRLSGRGCTKTISKLLTESKISPVQRDQLAVLCMDDKIIWLEDFGVAESFRPNKNTKKILVIKTGVDSN